jgi:carbonic anhydrase/acetyltransferase-like protein (isoleucine patch superfamily)
MATSPTSVTVIDGPLPDADALDARVETLRRRFPRAIIDRYLRHLPVVGRDALLAPGAVIAGDVQLGDDVSIWYSAVLRGDLAPVVIGAGSNVQDGAVLHVGDSSPCVVGRDTVVGHRAILHGCRIGDACLIGMQATVLDDSVIGDGSIVGAGALVTQRTIIPPRSLVLGVPARVIRALTEEDEQLHRELAAKYVRLKENYRLDSLRLSP